jgi:hypothetical protein
MLRFPGFHRFAAFLGRNVFQRHHILAALLKKNYLIGTARFFFGESSHTEEV